MTQTTIYWLVSSFTSNLPQMTWTTSWLTTTDARIHCDTKSDRFWSRDGLWWRSWVRSPGLADTSILSALVNLDIYIFRKMKSESYKVKIPIILIYIYMSYMFLKLCRKNNLSKSGLAGCVKNHFSCVTYKLSAAHMSYLFYGLDSQRGTGGL